MKSVKIIFAIELEKCVASASILGIIIDKFYYKNKLCLIILFKINKNSKINFHYTILSFN